MLLRTSVALASGVALAMAFEPIAWVVLLPFAVAALFLLSRGLRPRAGALVGLLFGLGFMGLLLVWLRAVGWDAWGIVVLFQAAYFALLGAGLAVVGRLRLWPVWMAVLWVGVEVVRGAWPLGGVSWGRIAFATADTPYAAWLPWVGSVGASLVVAASAALLAWLATGGLRSLRRPDVVRRGGALVLTVAVVCAPLALDWSGEDQGPFTVAVVQGDVPGDGDDLVAHHREVTRSHVQLTRGLADSTGPGLDLVVWPENTTAVDPFTNTAINEAIRDAAATAGAPVLLGGIVDAPDPDQVLNQGIVVDPETGPGDRYTKRHPVPFGEYIPFREVLGTAPSERLDLVPRDMLSGTRVEPLRVDGVEVADLICFDVAYDDALVDQVTRGAQLVVVQTSNALFIHTGQIEQQYAISRLRALETGRSVVVAAVNGRTGVIGPDGEEVAGLEPRTRDVLVETVRLTGGVPPSMVVGPWLGRACAVVGLLAVLVVVLPYRRGRSTS